MVPYTMQTFTDTTAPPSSENYETYSILYRKTWSRTRCKLSPTLLRLLPQRITRPTLYYTEKHGPVHDANFHRHYCASFLRELRDLLYTIPKNMVPYTMQTFTDTTAPPSSE